MEGKRTIESAGHSISSSSKLGLEFTLKSKPDFLAARLNVFSHIKERIEKILAATEKHNIVITLKDGKEIPGKSFQTTPLAIAKAISKNLAESALVARVKYTKKYQSPFGKGPVSAEAEETLQDHEYQLVDMTRPLEGDCQLQLITFEDKIGKEVFWHSSAHLLGESLENNFGAWLCHGPPLDNGFFYDSFMGDYRISQADYQKIEHEIQNFAQEKQPYERILLTKAQALQMFAYNPFKVQLIQSKVPEDGLTSAYRCGNLIDLCTGPHIPSADRVKGFKVTKNSSAYWLANKQNDDLQRVYAISFPKQAQLQEYMKQQQELAKHDHRTIGPKQQLFNFTPLAPGSALFYPHGAIIYNRLIQLMRSEYRIRGYSQVISPNIYNSELWKTSGHYFKYKENIFFITEQNGEENGLKPMNCPGHCVMFDLVQHSYRDLPIRMADFGVLHRNQLHGALSGLTRVRRFQQDDAHIFCMPEQIQQQILNVLDLLDYIYSVFGFKYSIELSTRPEKYLGKLEDWNVAEEQLKHALIKFGKNYKINQADGAFYGPKIDVKLFDVFGREHQCGTVQLDFQLPSRFNLQYRVKQVAEKEGIQGQQEQQEKQIHEQQLGGKHQSDKKQKKQPTPEQIQQRKKQKLQKKKKVEENLSAKQSVQQTAQKQQVPKQQVPAVVVKQTIQQMEERYNKLGNVRNGFARPVIIHRAIFGSLERFIAILCEHTGGKWDFWISPRQIRLIPMGNQAKEFTEQVYNTLLLKGYAVDIDNSGDNFKKKIRNAQLDAYNYIGVIGKEEVKEHSVNLRKRDEEKEIGRFKIDQILAIFENQKPPKSNQRIKLETNSLL